MPMRTITELTKVIESLCPREGSHATKIEGFFLTRHSTTEVPRTSLNEAVFCVVAQGAKSVLLNKQRLIYDPSKYLLVSLDLPLVGQIEEASRSKPFLGLSLVLNLGEIASLMRDADLPHETAPPLRSGLMIGSMADDLLDAVTRFTSLLNKPDHIAVLSPLVRREIFYKLLLSDQGSLLRRIVRDNGKVQRVAAGLAWLRRNAVRPIKVEELAREMRMSPSGMHSWFRAVTSMSPLQYQKQLRLQEARRMLLAEALDAATVSRRVGYQSASQFSREYRRFFGVPPMQDIERLRIASDLARSCTSSGQ